MAGAPEKQAVGLAWRGALPFCGTAITGKALNHAGGREQRLMD